MNPSQPARTNADIAKSNKQKLKWGLICLLGPTTLLIASILLYAVFNFISGGSNSTIVNVAMYLVGLVAVLTWLPGIIGGIVLLATRKPLQQ